MEILAFSLFYFFFACYFVHGKFFFFFFFTLLKKQNQYCQTWIILFGWFSVFGWCDGYLVALWFKIVLCTVCSYGVAKFKGWIIKNEFWCFCCVCAVILFWTVNFVSQPRCAPNLVLTDLRPFHTEPEVLFANFRMLKNKVELTFCQSHSQTLKNFHLS